MRPNLALLLFALFALLFGESGACKMLQSVPEWLNPRLLGASGL